MARPRVLLFCHDGTGLGHLRRISRLAGALTEQFSTLVLSGVREASWIVPADCGLVMLPNWDGIDPLTYGCLFGGSIEYTAYRNGYKAALDDCALTDRLPLTGDATIDTTRGTFALRVTGPSATSLAYGRDAKGKTSVTGTWFGKPASLSGQVAASARQHD